MRKNDIYIFNDEPLSIPLLHKITNQPVKIQQTNILDVHFHFDSDLTTEYTAIFEKLNQDTIIISVLTTQPIPIPKLTYRILGGPQHSMPEGTSYPCTTSYPSIYLMIPITIMDAVIPRIIVQTWRTSYVTAQMNYTIDAIVRFNPEYEYQFYDDIRALAFIKSNFNSYIVDAYESLIPGAYRADLFRYCYLYLHGGVYIDTKSVLHVPLYTFISYKTPMVLTDELIPECICTAIIATPPENPFLKYLIQHITWQILKQEKGRDHWDMSGPRAVGKALNMHLNQPETGHSPLSHLPTIRRLYNHSSPTYKYIRNMAGRPLLYKAYSTYYNDERSNNRGYLFLWENNLIFYKIYQPISDSEMLTFAKKGVLLISVASSS